MFCPVQEQDAIDSLFPAPPLNVTKYPGTNSSDNHKIIVECGKKQHWLKTSSLEKHLSESVVVSFYGHQRNLQPGTTHRDTQIKRLALSGKNPGKGWGEA